MAVLEIVKHPNEVLETPCERVINFDKKLVILLKDMYETMVAADGVGLAAPQVGVSLQVAVIDIGDDTGKIELINPVILEKRGEQVGPEGCLSFPGLYGEVERAEYIKVRAQNRRGKIFLLEANGFLARAIQHEIDHLHGVLFTSKVTRYYEENELEEK
ncbi:peptide deformylase [Bacillus cytotoxicus]|uniref:Peptide deformylase n=1 Tax=Bacillus cytotoxicus (strain DSM 22905 / CIP 110041 / 391-98 / NVH 391-98) TaxID=315749 RepID=A7GRJ7_BACCN|nr:MULTISPECIES: peptide deformylase [Bacillus cereus group]ABS22755.1 peptide deformylase [Bacillus cytotoxicus NVH 391-98]AWC29420.1 peptide deformylase [Bacillus cytotoxicus]AWC33431.1 peptide deformylase [Bacillus cytotoxicus]AWC37411.1 peptide deformylase [Bacillus cytotoxicus]AWC41549.1 peptide deformylase [Bacillus cytotoxicus]